LKEFGVATLEYIYEKSQFLLDTILKERELQKVEEASQQVFVFFLSTSPFQSCILTPKSKMKVV